MRTALWVILISLIISVPAAAQYRPEYMLNRLDTLIAKAESQIADIDSLVTLADSITTLLSQPGPVEVWSDNTILTADIKRSNVILSGPQTGLYVEGAVGMMVVCTFDSLDGRNNDKVTIKQWFVSTAGDTTSKCVDTLGDTITLDGAIYGKVAGSLTWFPKMKNGQGCFTGYYYNTVDSWGVVTLRNFQVTARMVYK